MTRSALRETGVRPYRCVTSRPQTRYHNTPDQLGHCCKIRPTTSSCAHCVPNLHPEPFSPRLETVDRRPSRPGQVSGLREPGKASQKRPRGPRMPLKQNRGLPIQVRCCRYGLRGAAAPGTTMKHKIRCSSGSRKVLARPALIIPPFMTADVFSVGRWAVDTLTPCHLATLRLATLRLATPVTQCKALGFGRNDFRKSLLRT